MFNRIRSCGWVLALSLTAVMSGCSTSFLKHSGSQEILKNDEFDKALEVKELPPAEALSGPGTYVRLPGPAPAPAPAPQAKAKDPAPVKNSEKPDKTEKRVGRRAKDTSNAMTNGWNVTGGAAADPKETEIAKPMVREPKMEDSEGFIERRPAIDPYRVGEKVTLEASYFSVVAGDMTLETRPFVEVNGRKSYRFAGTAISTSVFAMFYAVDDWFETYVDYENMIPYSYALHVKESKQLRETRSVFDWDRKIASWWDKKIDAEGKIEEKKAEWELPDYAQNVFTEAYYLRAFTLKPGKKIAFRIAHEKENLVMTTEVIRRERISTPAGDFNTVVLKPKIELNGVFKPVGDIFVWMTDDDRKFIVKVESKIKIGKIIAIAKKVERGRE